jgi:hypothetical protein
VGREVYGLLGYVLDRVLSSVSSGPIMTSLPP